MNEEIQLLQKALKLKVNDLNIQIKLQHHIQNDQQIITPKVLFQSLSQDEKVQNLKTALAQLLV